MCSFSIGPPFSAGFNEGRSEWLLLLTATVLQCLLRKYWWAKSITSCIWLQIADYCHVYCGSTEVLQRHSLEGFHIIWLSCILWWPPRIMVWNPAWGDPGHPAVDADPARGSAELLQAATALHQGEWGAPEAHSEQVLVQINCNYHLLYMYTVHVSHNMMHIGTLISLVFLKLPQENLANVQHSISESQGATEQFKVWMHACRSKDKFVRLRELGCSVHIILCGYSPLKIQCTAVWLDRMNLTETPPAPLPPPRAQFASVYINGLMGWECPSWITEETWELSEMVMPWTGALRRSGISLCPYPDQGEGSFSELANFSESPGTSLTFIYDGNSKGSIVHATEIALSWDCAPVPRNLEVA